MIAYKRFKEIRLACSNGKFATVKHKFTSQMLPFLFDDYRMQQLNYFDDFSSEDMVHFEKMYNTLVNASSNVSINVQILSALCQVLEHKVSEEEFRYFVIGHTIPCKYPISDLYYFVASTNIEIPISLSAAGLLFRTSVDFGMLHVQKLTPAFAEPLTNELINEMDFQKPTTSMNMQKHIEQYGIKVTSKLPNLSIQNFKIVVPLSNLNYTQCIMWLKDSLAKNLYQYFEFLLATFPQHLSITLQEDSQTLFFECLFAKNEHLMDLCTKSWPSLLQSQWLQWESVVRRYGRRRSISFEKYIRSHFPHILSVINFEYEIPAQRKEIWQWFGVGSAYNQDRTYACVPYDSRLSATCPVREDFKRFKTVEDVKNNAVLLNGRIRSPTDCYFHCDDKSDIFYRDSQGCILWALDDQGRVYVHDDDDDLFERTFVARSLAEFLTSVLEDARCFYESKSHCSPVELGD